MRDPLTIEAGTLRTPVDIQQQTTQQDAAGQPSATWTAVMTTRASIRTLTLSERSSAAGFTSEATHRITLRYRSTLPIVEGMRVAFGMKAYTIQSVENVLERNRVITCLALELETTQ